MALMSRLDGVNRILMNSGVRPVSILDTGNASEASDAERILDFESRSAQLAGWHDNVTPCVKHTATGAGAIILGTTVIGIKSAGSSAHRSLAMRLNGSNAQVYDLNKNTFVFANSEEVFLDLLFEIPFEGCAPSMQEVILKAATEVYQRQFKGNPILGKELKEERVRAEVNIHRGSGRSTDPGSNAPPFAVGGGGGGGGQGQGA